jgi:peptidoglycan/LPS O-acetylase OafA/YrhL
MTISAHNNRPESFRPDINGLRAIAVAVVVLYHFGVPGFQGGFVGVDIFFVISGFLMTKIIASKLLDGTFSLRDFYLARSRRIVPALAALCGIMLVFGWFSLEPRDYKVISLHAASSLAFLSNFTYWKETGYFDSSASEKWLLHTWSLSVEWQFYLVFPLLLLIAWRLTAKRGALVLAVAGALVASLAISILMSARFLEFSYYLLPTREWELAAGGLAYFATPHFRPSHAVARVLEILGSALIIIAATRLSSTVPWPGYLGLVPIVGSVLIILAQNTQSLVTANPLSSFVGNSSYSIYLWHWPIAVALTLKQLKGEWLWQIIGIALSITLGYLSYRWVELPTRSKRSTVSPRIESFAYVAITAVLISAALFVYAHNGLTLRLNEDENNYLATARAVKDWEYPGSNCVARDGVQYCEHSGAADNLVMFIGDSVAEQWYPRYGAPQQRYLPTITFITRPGCVPVRQIDGYPPGFRCSERAPSIWQAVRDRKPDKLVIASAWWPDFFFPDGTMRNAACVVEGGGCTAIVTRAQLDRSFGMLEADISDAIASGIQVYIIGPIPIGNIDYAEAKLSQLADRQLLAPLTKSWQQLHGFVGGLQTLSAGLASLENANSLTPSFRLENGSETPSGVMLSILSGIAKRTGATLVTTQSSMCPANSCPLTDKSGVPIYMDVMHLRAQFVRTDALLWLDAAIGIGAPRH